MNKYRVGRFGLKLEHRDININKGWAEILYELYAYNI